MDMTDTTDSAATSQDAHPQRLEHFPVTLFGSVMGLAGLAVAYMRFEHITHAEVGHVHVVGVGEGILFLTTAWFALLTLVYLLKGWRYPAAVLEEFNHPIRVNFFPAYSISLLLLSIGYLELAPKVSFVLWVIATPMHLGYTLKIINVWLTKEFELHTINPAWFIPVVGTILVPIAGVVHADPEISWFFFSVGILFWLVLFTIVIYRIIFHHPLPKKLLPTLFIFIAPPAVGFMAYVKLTGVVDSTARILFYFGVFTFLLLLMQINRFRKLPFFTSWWAYTFPMDALTLSVLLFYAKTKIPLFLYTAYVLLPITTALILYVAWRTVISARQGEICIPE